MMSRRDKPGFLQETGVKLLFFGGKGGVGKTTCAAATALQLALDFPSRLFLLVSTDPAHSLQDRLIGVTIPGNLQVLELDALALLDEFKQNYAQFLQQIAARGTFLEEADVQPLIDLSLPGLDELMAFLRLGDWINEEKYQTIIVDTAPTGHTLRLLEMPGLLKRWLRALDALLAKHRYMRRVLTGKVVDDELDRFLGDFANKIEQLENLLHDDQACHFVPVLLAEPLSEQETRRLLSKLADQQIAVSEVIFNQCAIEFPQRVGQQAVYRQFKQTFASRYQIWQLPVINDIATQLASFWDVGQFHFQSIDKIDKIDEIDVSALTIMVEQVAPLPAAQVKLQFFVGKGGVGKTTLACATALHLATRWPSQKILLFSTDPAHSLADCLNLTFDEGVSNVIQNNLAAIEIQPTESFAQLKQQYAVAIKDFLIQCRKIWSGHLSGKRCWRCWTCRHLVLMKSWH
jgi:arsenite-transporting ATPase